MKYRIRYSRNTVESAPKRHRPKPYAYREYTDRSFDETTTELNNQRNLWDIFLRDNETSTPCRDVQVIRDFCEMKDQTREYLLEPEIRLDDRQHGTNGMMREYPHSLTTDDLSRYLSLERFGLENHPDADHRQISIRNLDPDSIFVLAQTAAHHQRDTLKDAFSKHISCGTSIRIHERVNGFVTPRLELHLPYLTLRKISSESDEWKARASNGERHGWLDIDLPESKAERGDRPNRFLIKESHTSIVICVWDYSKWVGYAFFKGSPANAGADTDDEIDIETDGEGNGGATGDESNKETSDVTSEIMEESDPIPRTEIFAPDDDHHDMYADNPIRDPRKFFLRTTAVWMTLVAREYKYLIEELEVFVEDWEREDRDKFLNVSCKVSKDDVMQLFHRIVKRKELLVHVRKRIASLVREWNNFNGPNGDIRCLKDIRAGQARVLLKDINGSFVELMRFEQTLASLITSCEDLASDLQLRMGFEGNQINLESNRFQREAYALNRESHDLQRRAHIVNLDTQLISRRTTEAAENTSHTTRTNILMIWMTTPFVIVLQYFGADQPIFSFFERNPRNFGISFCVLALAFPLLTCIFEYAFDFFTTRFRPRKTQTARAPGDTLDSRDVP